MLQINNSLSSEEKQDQFDTDAKHSSSGEAQVRLQMLYIPRIKFFECNVNSWSSFISVRERQRKGEERERKRERERQRDIDRDKKKDNREEDGEGGGVFT